MHIRFRLTQLPIRIHFVFLMVLLAVSLALSSSFLVFVIKKEEYKQMPVKEVDMISRALEYDYASLLLMGLPSSSFEVSNKWKAFPMLRRAVLEDTTGDVVLYFSRNALNEGAIDTQALKLDSVLDGDVLLMRDVMFEGKHVGQAKYIISNKGSAILIDQLADVLLLMIPVIVLVAFLMSLFLQHILLRPFDKLMAAITSVTQDQIHADRIKVDNEDKSEFGLFAKSFNGLLKRIQITFADVKKSKAHTQRLAYYDVLTGLPNRRMYAEHIESVLEATKGKDRYGAMLFIDLDYFKNLNDSRGHAAGDYLLKQVAERLQAVFRADDMIARLGGDEFIVILDNSEKSRQQLINKVLALLAKLREKMSERFIIFDESYQLTISVGISTFSGIDSSPEEIMSQADRAMYHAKDSGRDGHQFYRPSMKKLADERVLLEKELRKVVEKNELELFYQPQVDEQGEVVGAEGLLRWKRCEDLISPTHFISVAEQTGLIVPIGEWILKTGFERLKAWQEKGLSQNFFLALNISQFQFRQDNFVTRVRELIKETGVNVKQLKFEVTESLLISNLDDTIEKMKELSSLGIRLSMDDFGTGYSSLLYLKKLPIDELKIDQAFVCDLNVDEASDGLAEAIISMAKHLNLSVVAEGVETEGQLLFLRKHGCHVFQGFYFYKPMPLAEIESLIL
ncbi:MAG: hypothetical protein A6F71_00015 [Cycloclasticus sp. symbiont of Poecilosclerida sp. M]|nr:MAG: hypothetical protein A6F71_00015 [Cycloclasticus sp. symbiont of Poecilosclerida sp. M]